MNYDPKYLAFNSDEYDTVEKTYKNNTEQTKLLKKDVDKTEEGCTCLDNYIDDI